MQLIMYTLLYIALTPFVFMVTCFPVSDKPTTPIQYWLFVFAMVVLGFVVLIDDIKTE